jgi:uncharacterized membrane protein YuzA (DUF378 family)
MMHVHGTCSVHKVAAALVWVGAINWGLVGFFNYNLVDALLGSGSTLSRVVYALVGISALLMLGCCKCKMCMGAKKPGMEAKM